MSLFQCSKCGCRENTAVSNWAWRTTHGQEPLCSACDPLIGKWHEEFPRIFLPLGEFKTNQVGNLEHIATGDTDVSKYQIDMLEVQAFNKAINAAMSRFVDNGNGTMSFKRPQPYLEKGSDNDDA